MVKRPSAIRVHDTTRKALRVTGDRRVLAVASLAGILSLGLSVSVDELETLWRQPSTLRIGDGALGVTPEQGLAYVVDLSPLELDGSADDLDNPFRSSLRLYEDGHALVGHTVHQQIRTAGGYFSHWRNALIFSASDGSDPRVNGRGYTATIEQVADGRLRFLLTAIPAVSAGLVFVWFLVALAFVASSGSQAPAANLNLVLTAVCSLVIVVSGAREAIVQLLVRDATISVRVAGPPEPQEGRIFSVDLAALGVVWLGSSWTNLASGIVLRENGVPLREQSRYEDVNASAGSYSRRGNVLLFSTSDGTDPRSNGYEYTMSGRVISRPALATVLFRVGQLTPVLVFLCGLALCIAFSVADASAHRSNVSARILAGALIVGSFVQFTVTRTHYGITPDSASYTTWPGIRPPGYYAVMHVVSDLPLIQRQIRGIAERGLSNHILVSPNSAGAIVNVVNAQKTILIAAALVMYFALTRMIGPFCAASLYCFVADSGPKEAIMWSPPTLQAWWLSLLSLLLLMSLAARATRLARVIALIIGAALVVPPVIGMAFRADLSSLFAHYIMSEHLTLASMLLMIAGLTFAFSNRQPGGLYAASVGAFCANMMRPAAVFTVPMVAGPALWLCWASGSRSIIRWMSPVVMMVALLFVPKLANEFGDASEVKSQSTMSWALVAVGLQAADDSDVSRMPSEKARVFLTKALELKREVDRSLPSVSGHAWERLNPNMYRVALPTAAMVLGQHATEEDVANLFVEVARPLYARHAKAIALNVVNAFRFAVTEGTRLTQVQGFAWTMFGWAVLVLVARGPLSALSVTLMAGHVMHLVVVTAFDAPIPRYVYFTEFLVVFALLLTLLEATRRCCRLWHVAARREDELRQ